MMDPLNKGLGRRKQFDPASRAFGIAPLMLGLQPRSYTWSCHVRLDQGDVGACVGFAWAAELAARPVIVPGMTNASGLLFYRGAQAIDGFDDSQEGTSVLAGAKVVRTAGHIPEYRWGFGLQDVLVGISRGGPGVFGLNWYRGMSYPDAEGIIRPTGPIDGGHAILGRGVSMTRGLVRLHNSWGAGWGRGGDCYISFEDLDRLLHEEGEFAIPLSRALRANL
jgi:hypothetical protein